MSKILRSDSLIPLWVIIAIYIISTVYSYSWDIYMDWGLLRTKSAKRRFLRDKLFYPTWFYYFAAVSNLFLRCAWLTTFMTPQMIKKVLGDKEMLLFILALLEALRRS